MFLILDLYTKFHRSTQPVSTCKSTLTAANYLHPAHTIAKHTAASNMWAHFPIGDGHLRHTQPGPHPL